MIRMLDCSEKKVYLLSNNDTPKNYHIQREKKKQSFSGMFLFEIPE